MYGKDIGFIPNADLRGWKHAQVVSNEDPKGQERILVRVLGVHNMANTDTDNAIWANHCAPVRTASGDLPEPGDWLYGQFVNSKDFMAFIWFGYVRSSFQEGEKGTPEPNKTNYNVVTRKEEPK